MTPFVFSNCEWSRQYVDAPFFSRFAPAIELDVDPQGFCNLPDASSEEANIRAAQAILFRRRSKPLKEDQHVHVEPKNVSKRIGVLTPNKGALASPWDKMPVMNFTPVKFVVNGTAATPSSARSAIGSQQRLEILLRLNFDVCC
jgi:hypothetical protein